MVYGILYFELKYQDGNVKKAFTPYRGETFTSGEIVQFVKGYFGGADQVEVITHPIKQFDSEEDWIKNVYYIDSFRYLYKHHNFANDLITQEALYKYFE